MFFNSKIFHQIFTKIKWNFADISHRINNLTNEKIISTNFQRKAILVKYYNFLAEVTMVIPW